MEPTTEQRLALVRMTDSELRDNLDYWTHSRYANDNPREAQEILTLLEAEATERGMK